MLEFLNHLCTVDMLKLVADVLSMSRQPFSRIKQDLCLCTNQPIW